VFAQTESSIDNIVPTVENSQPTAAPVKKETVIPDSAPAQPDFSTRRTKLKQRLNRENVSASPQPVRQSRPKIETSESTPTVRISKEAVRQSRPKIETSEPAPTVEFIKPQSETPAAKPKNPPNSLPAKQPEVAQPATNSNSAVNATTGKTKDYNNAYIDPTDYNSGTTGNYQAPSSVVVTERSSGCRTIVSGQGVTNCNRTPQTPRVADAEHKSAPSWLKKSENASLANAPISRPTTTIATNLGDRGLRATRTIAGGVTKTAFRPNRFIPNPSEFSPTTVSATPITPSGGTLPPPMAEGNVAPRESTVAYDFALASVLPQVPYNGGTVAYRGTGMMFPLSVPAPITSLFGWRIHPITGDRRFHAGADLGAPQGTPILAAAKGQVESANWMGGYGLTVVINHSSAQQTLYGHMSEIFVQPGQWVEPGTVIGRVGSTGNSTGPHLHFEVRNLTQNGWVAVDPGVELQGALSQLVQSLRTAQVSQEPGS
jgi:murein DD-endopeptidase MepM/ murein hydrolase activator NlpD